MNSNILVTGSTGNIGQYTAKTLYNKGAQVNCAVTSPDRARVFLDEGMKVIQFDFLDKTTYEVALEGVDRVFLIRPPMINNPGDMYSFIDALKDSGIKHITFVSLLCVERNPFPPHYKIEKYIKSSNIPFTFLRPSFFMQNLNTAHLKDIKDNNDIFLPAGKAKVSFIDTRDIGEAAANVLLDPKKHQYKSYTLTGPEAVTYNEAANIFSEVLGRQITYSDPSIFKFRKTMIKNGVPKGFVNIMAILYLTTRFGMAKQVTHDLKELLEREPHSLKDYVKDHSHYWK